jgi:acyl carrier protein
MQSSLNIEEEIRRFLRRSFPLGVDAAALRTDASLLDAGIIDSTGVLELVEFVESRFQVEVPDTDLLPEHFDSIGNIARYVTRRTEDADEK